MKRSLKILIAVMLIFAIQVTFVFATQPDEYPEYYDAEPIYWDMGENPDGENIMPIMADLNDEFEDLEEEYEELEAVRENLPAENNRNFLFGLIAIIVVALAVTCIRVIKKAKKFETNEN